MSAQLPRPIWARYLIAPPLMEARGPVCFSPRDWPPSNGCPPGAPVVDAVVMPALCNSHLHLLDSGLPEHGEDLELEQLVAQPTGLKYRLLRRLPRRRLVEASSRALSLMKSRGAPVAAVYAEMGLDGAYMVAEAASEAGVRARILPQPADPSSPSEAVLLAAEWGGLGLDTPLSMEHLPPLTGDIVVEVHVSEDQALNRLGDQLLAARHAPLVGVHMLNLSEGEVLELARAGVYPVFCPRSNMFFTGSTPPVRSLVLLHEEMLPAGIGTDNAAWIPPRMDEEIQYAYTAARAHTEPGLRAALARAILYAATIAGCGSMLGIRDEYTLVARVPSISYSGDPVVTVVKRLSSARIEFILRRGLKAYQ